MFLMQCSGISRYQITSLLKSFFEKFDFFKKLCIFIKMVLQEIKSNKKKMKFFDFFFINFNFFNF